MSRPFVFLLIAALVLGISLGGAFAGGVAFGKSQQSSGATALAGAQFPGQPGQGLSGQLRPGIQRGQSNPFGPEDQQGQQSQGQSRPADGQDLTGRGTITGIIEKIEEDTVILNTPQGQLKAVILGDTAIQKVGEGTVDDLQTGARVAVSGQPREEGVIEARAILITPPGAANFFGRDSLRQGGFQRGQ